MLRLHFFRFIPSFPPSASIVKPLKLFSKSNTSMALLLLYVPFNSSRLCSIINFWQH